MTTELPNPASRKEEYLAKAAGMSGITLPDPASREEIYLDAIAKNGGGGGGSYTAGDGIDITNDTISVDTDTIQEKLTAGSGIDITNNTISATGGSTIELTSADYNWPTDNPDGVALWLMPAGTYVNSGIKVYINTSLYGTHTTAGRAFIVLPGPENYLTTILYCGSASGGHGNFFGGRIALTNKNNGSSYEPNDGQGAKQMILRTNDVVDNLTTSYDYVPLSANQGMVLKGLAVGDTESYTLATSDWSSLSSSDPYTYQATVTATHTIGNSTVAELLNDSAVTFATYGFAIGSISGQSVTIYSIGQPSSSVTLKVNYKG